MKHFFIANQRTNPIKSQGVEFDTETRELKITEFGQTEVKKIAADKLEVCLARLRRNMDLKEVK